MSHRISLPPPYPALTVRQPFASALMAGAKTHEFRGRRGPEGWIAIHAGATPHEALRIPGALPPRPWWRGCPEVEALPYGTILGLVRLGPSVPSSSVRGPWALPSGMRDRYPWAWPVLEVLPLRLPIPASGAIGVWRPEPCIQGALRALALAAA